jgi:hypothetical protein
MNPIRGLIPTMAAIALAIFVPASAVLAKNSNAAFPQLSGEWWQWVLSIPPSMNPLLDTTGENCMVGQHGTTWFLAGSWVSGPVTRDCDIPQDAALFFPVINEINFDTPGQCGQGAPLPASFYRSLSAAFVNGAANLSVTLDGISAGPMHRTQSQVFEVALPDNNLFVGACSPDLTGGVYSPAVDDGYYVRLNPLGVGAHTLHIHGENPSVGFALDVTYNLNVVPVVNQ